MENSLTAGVSGSTAFDRPGARILFGRFMLPDMSEHPCQVCDLSIDGGVFLSEFVPPSGLPIVAYIDGVGRVVGVSSDAAEGGFKVKFTFAASKRDRLASRLQSLSRKADAEYEEELETRSAPRIEPANSTSNLSLSDGRVYACEVLDISLTGASIRTEILPALGAYVILGKMRGRIVRYTEQGIAIEFVRPLDQASLAKHIR
jgi:hypothetical protein